MLYFPKYSEISNKLPIKSVSAILSLDDDESERLENNVEKITVVNEISSSTCDIAKGKRVKAFFVLHLKLKKQNFDSSVIINLSKLINGYNIFVLEYDEKCCIAVYYRKKHLICTDWMPKKKAFVDLVGADMDEMWKNIIFSVGEKFTYNGKNIQQLFWFDDKVEEYEHKELLLKAQIWATRDVEKKIPFVLELTYLRDEFKEFLANNS